MPVHPKLQNRKINIGIQFILFACQFAFTLIVRWDKLVDAEETQDSSHYGDGADKPGPMKGPRTMEPKNKGTFCSFKNSYRIDVYLLPSMCIKSRFSSRQFNSGQWFG
jgi:hypothetical protein